MRITGSKLFLRSQDILLQGLTVLLYNRQLAWGALAKVGAWALVAKANVRRVCVALHNEGWHVSHVAVRVWLRVALYC